MIAAFQQQAASGAATWRSIREHALKRLKCPEEPLVKENVPDGGALELAFAYCIWQERAFLDAALAQIQTVLAAPTWVWHHPLKIDLRSCMVSSCLALVYDLLHADLSREQRDEIGDGILRHDLGSYRGIVQSGSEWWTRCRMNWQGVVHGHVGIAVLALIERLPDWKELLRLATVGVLDLLDAQPADGSYREGLQYWQFGIGEAAWFGFALKNASGGEVDLFQHPYLRATGDFALHMSTPDGCFDFADCCNFRPNDWFMALLAREYRDSTLQAMVAPLDLRSPRFRKVDVPARGMRYALTFDESLASERVLSPACSRHFEGSATVCMRSDWGPNATYVALQAGAKGPHTHLDAGSFIIGTAGRRLIPDAGFWPYGAGFFETTGRRWDFDGTARTGHSVLEIDDGGPSESQGKGGVLSSVVLNEGADRIVCDLTDAYGGKLARYRRYFVFLHPDLVIVFDDVQAHRPAFFRWNLQTAGELTFGPSGGEIRNGDASASVTFFGLDRRRGYRVASESRLSCYEPTVEDGLPPPAVRRLHLSPLHAQISWRVGAVISVGTGGRLAGGEVEFFLAGEDVASLTCSARGRRTQVNMILSSGDIAISGDSG